MNLAGKGTLITRLRTDFPSLFTKSVSHTTRAPRQGEVDGVSYNFVTRERFEEMITESQFVEWANVHGNLYGTSVQTVLEHGRMQRICVLEIDVQGADVIRSLGKLVPPPYYTFVRPPHYDVLEQRMRGRGSESEQTLQERLQSPLSYVLVHHPSHKICFFSSYSCSS